ncbi:MAG: AMP-binding protein [Deltaproteobacteria bacterium]|nr:AMP-binding protein [Deltaproteobacteria bacterium]
MLIDRLLQDTSQRTPEKTALVHTGYSVSYGEILKRSTGLACALQGFGLKKGDRVVIALDNGAEYLVAYFGTLLAGCVTVPINPLTSAAGCFKIMANCCPKAVIAGPALLRSLEQRKSPFSFLFVLVSGDLNTAGPSGILLTSFEECCTQGAGKLKYGARTDEDLASIIYTSGTTGEPKGVMLSHRNLSANTGSIVDYLGLSEADSVMVVLPFHYSYGNSLLLTHVMQSGTLVVANSFIYPNVIIDRIQKERVTGFAGVPSTFAILCHRSNFKNSEFPHLRYITQAGGPMPHAMAYEILKTVPHIKLYIMYGQTEASARLSYLPPEDLHRKHGSVGKAIPGVKLEVLNDKGEPVKPGETGEITARGGNIMLGYWENPEETSKVIREGRLFTGDMATVDEEGYIYIVSRKRDMIKSGAHRIAPREIEEVILEHPSVIEAAVVGKPDPMLGESICAFVVLKDGQACAENELMRLCGANLPPFKMPKKIYFVSSLPKTQSGKVMKEELKKLNPAEVKR